MSYKDEQDRILNTFFKEKLRQLMVEKEGKFDKSDSPGWIDVVIGNFRWSISFDPSADAIWDLIIAQKVHEKAKQLVHMAFGVDK